MAVDWTVVKRGRNSRRSVGVASGSRGGDARSRVGSYASRKGGVEGGPRATLITAPSGRSAKGVSGRHTSGQDFAKQYCDLHVNVTRGSFVDS